MFFSKKKLENSYTLLLDFRNSSLAFGLIQNSPDKDIVLKAGRKNFYFKKIENSNQYIETFYTEIRLISNQILKEYPFLIKKLEKIEILLSSPWYESKIKNFDIQDQKNIKISQKFLDNLIQKNTLIQINQKLLESKITNVKINGYNIESPIGKKAEKLEFSVYQSFIGTGTDTEIKNILKPYFHNAEVYFNSHPLILFTTLFHNFYEISNFLIFDVGGEMTELTYVMEDRIKGIYTIPVGINALIRKLIKECNYEEHVAWTKLDMLSWGHLDEAEFGIESKIFKNFKKEWLESIKETFEKNEILSSPPNIFIISDKSIQKLIKEILSDPEGYAGTIKNNRKPEINIINHELLINKINYKNISENDTIISIFLQYLKLLVK